MRHTCRLSTNCHAPLNEVANVYAELYPLITSITVASPGIFSWATTRSAHGARAYAEV